MLSKIFSLMLKLTNKRTIEKPILREDIFLIEMNLFFI